MARMRCMVYPARLLGLAPYRLLSSSCGADQWERSLPLQLLSLLALTGLTVGWLLPWILYFDTSAAMRSVESQAELVGLALCSGQTIVILAALLFRQHPALLQIVNSQQFANDNRAPPLLWVIIYIALDLSGMLFAPWSILKAALRRMPAGVAFTSFVCGVLYYIPRTVIPGMFAYLALCVSSQIDEINGVLREVVAKGHRRRSPAPGDRCGTISALRSDYKNSYMLCERISACFGPQLTAQFLSHFWWFTQNTFSLVCGGSWSHGDAFLLFTDTVRLCLMNILLIILADRLKSKAAGTLDLIHEIENRSGLKDAGESEELRKFSQQVSQRPCRMRLCGAIELDFDSIFKAAGLAVTYTIVLRQFEQK